MTAQLPEELVEALLRLAHHGLGPGGERHVTPRDDYSSLPSGAPGAAVHEKPPVLVCVASAAPEPGQTP